MTAGGAGAGVTKVIADSLLPYQRRWLADQAQVKVYEKSRRIGATWVEAADAVLSAAQTGC